MPPSQLRIYRGPQTREIEVVEADRKPPRVSARLGEILPLLVEASRENLAWVRDFDDDEVTLSADLYEVLLASRYYRRPSA